MYPRNIFTRFSGYISRIAGHPMVFTSALLMIILWAALGPFFGFSDTWQLAINTSTTIITFLMVFLIQSTQNRDTHALQLKLDELIRVDEKAHNALLDIEELSEKDLEKIRFTYKKIAGIARKNLREGKVDTGIAKFQSGVKKKSHFPG